ncbi:uncharacterized protein LOC110092721 [Dendrobium catenatum]|uniref:Uncharacterized protein n=1 Tax=Dendrobium catenatum TaxID=906689 RepID=A0A2I0X0Z9_9ASPA|nr:uncharacterized protein LOC110092721 [Dendrobium catenatum]PKU81598.1 hypothetical protein MA16_Dca013029 [Dendrobium catenatum]
MYLKKRELWGGTAASISGEGSGGDARGPGQAATGLPPETAATVGELVSSLDRRRMHREVTLALRSGIRDATADFSFLRLRGLRNLLKSLRSIANSDDAIRVFRYSQTLSELQVVPVLFNNSLKQLKNDPIVKLDQIFGVEPMKISSPATDSEVALALRVLEGCCLLHRGSAALAHQHKAVKVLINMLSNRGTLEQGACLDALISLMLESSANQLAFEACRGIEKIADLIKDEEVDEGIRLKCGEFLLLLIGHVNGRRDHTPLANIHEDIRQLLGEKCASLIWATCQFGSNLDPEQRQTVLHVHARRVLEALELYY